MLRRLVYLSHATREMFDEDLEDILVKSRQNNGRDGISGLLLFHDGTFFQCLEGDDSALMETLTRIHLDKRHRGVRVIDDINVEDRLFPNWEMGFEPRLNSPQTEGFVELRSKVEGGYSDESLNQKISDFLKTFACQPA